MASRREIADVRLSGSPETVALLADAMATLDGWTVLDISEAYTNRRDPGERRYLTLRQGWPAASAIRAWLAKNGWQKQPDGTGAAMWSKLGAEVLIPLGDCDERTARGVLERVAAAEGADLGELVALIDHLASGSEGEPQPGGDDHAPV